MNKILSKIRASLLCGALILYNAISVSAQTDTLRVMTYNVLYYGDTPPCQGPHSESHGYLKTIVAFSNPDLIGLEKMAAIPIYTGDHSGSAPAGFADSVLQFALNAAYPGRYAYCTYTNTSAADNIDVLFYNQQKLGFVNILSSYSNITDFNTYKLYYKSADLASTHDTVFLYVTLNHDNSGSGSSDAAIRADQINGEMAHIESHFTSLPNAINMGDFNTHNSDEACYQTLVAPANTAFRYYDPPFSPDGEVSYPADWDNNPSTYAAFLTTSTRQSNLPNSCGSNGGGKSWYDHIFLSAAIINGAAGLSYIPHSYRTVGNDGNRVGISVNDAPTNTSAPSDVIEALFQMSNKYPILVDLAVNPHNVGIAETAHAAEEVTVINPVCNELTMHLPASLIGKTIHIQAVDMPGSVQLDHALPVTSQTTTLQNTLRAGTYLLRLSSDGQVFVNKLIVSVP